MGGGHTQQLNSSFDDRLVLGVDELRARHVQKLGVRGRIAVAVSLSPGDKEIPNKPKRSWGKRSGVVSFIVPTTPVKALIISRGCRFSGHHVESVINGLLLQSCTLTEPGRIQPLVWSARSTLMINVFSNSIEQAKCSA